MEKLYSISYDRKWIKKKCDLILIVINIFVLSLFKNSEAKTLLEQIGWSGASKDVIILLLLICILLIALLILIYLFFQLKTKKEQVDTSKNLFEDYCEKADLLPIEKKVLEQLLSHETVQYPHTIFQSASLFERCVDAEVKLLILTKGSVDAIEDEERLLSSLRKKLGYGYLPLEHPLISSRNIETGQIVSIFEPTTGRLLIHRAVISQKKETFFRLQYNADKEENIINFLPGQTLRIAFARRGDGVYGIDTEICRIPSPSSLDCLHTLEFKRNQMRHYVRMEVSLPIKVTIVKVNKEKPSEKITENISAKIADISGGGLSFIYDKPLTAGEIVTMSFSLPTEKFNNIKGKILRVSVQEGKTETKYRHHVQYLSMEQCDRDKIVKFIFEKQRQQNQMRV
ncbi:MAG: PilZ domain-containing protein [Chitinispirillaceae bacterium]|nr:PilZ domain-containing protein [Chitinispirillaceae bacterium]